MGRTRASTVTLFGAWTRKKQRCLWPLPKVLQTTQLGIQIQQTRILYKLSKIQFYLAFSDISTLAGQIFFPTLVSLDNGDLHFSSMLDSIKGSLHKTSNLLVIIVLLCVCGSVPELGKSPGLETRSFRFITNTIWSLLYGFCATSFPSLPPSTFVTWGLRPIW